MKSALHPQDYDNRVIVIGAGIAGLATAARLAHAGRTVLVLEKEATVGGKIRCVESSAGPVDAGPTVLTMLPVFERLFADLGEDMGEHVTLIRQPLIARHFWTDGSQLDLYDDDARNREAIRDFAGARAAAQFERFDTLARQLFDALDAPMMQTPAPTLLKLSAYVAMRPWLLPRMAPFKTLDDLLRSVFDEPRLRQLFGRYATYVGGSPYRSPALLALIWRAEAAGVWAVEGGIHALARAIAGLAERQGAVFRFGARVRHIEVENGQVTGVVLSDNETLRARTVVFNGDPRALARGTMGTGVAGTASATKAAGRSLSAEVWAFAARATGCVLAHHNVFFRDDPRPEFDMLEQGKLVADPTIYVCAMDRGQPGPVPSTERFETIANAPPLIAGRPDEEFTRCQTRTFQTLARFGLRFDHLPGPEHLTTPTDFDRLFPASAGSLYGQSPHGMTAALHRPKAQTRIRGLYLTGGGTHPGAGLPMATLSARHAAETILRHQISTSTSRRTATPGGMSMASATAADVPSASSGS